jgi:hypothetical protein
MKSAQETVLSGCEADLGPISKTATALVGDAQDIVLLLNNSDDLTPIDEICDESDEVVPYKDELCNLREKEAKKNSKTDHRYEAPVDPETRNNNGDAWARALMNMGQAFGNYFNTPRPAINPYGSYYPVTTPYVRPMDISTKIMSPAYMSGYGNYIPSGLAPYGGGYAARYGFSSSSYFNYPVGR